MIRARANEYAIDPDRIVFTGFSAGAHVAAYMGLNADSAADHSLENALELDERHAGALWFF